VEQKLVARNTIQVMNKTRDILRATKPPTATTSPDLKAKSTENSGLPGCSGNSSLYIEEIHFRAETVTPILKEIPGYLLGHEKN
jgi:hypothetical protein